MDYTQTEYPWTAATATLRVRKDDLDPDAVTSRLGLRPTGSRVPGPDRWDPEGDEAGLWLLDVGSWPKQSLAEQLEKLSAIAEAHTDEFRALIAEGCEVTVIAFGFTGGIAHLEISPECVRRFGAVGIPLHLDPSTNTR